MTQTQDHLASLKYFDRHFDRVAVKVLPGEYYAGRNPELMVTVLGSCVTVCLLDPFSGVGGMNHFLLPGNQDDPDLTTSSGRYGVYAMELLINHLLKLGARRERLQAKVFGGGNVLKGFGPGSVGERNVEFVLRYLATEGLKVYAKDVLGNSPRKVYFFPDSDQVLVRKINDGMQSLIVDQEKDYQRQLLQDKPSSSVELFI